MKIKDEELKKLNEIEKQHYDLFYNLGKITFEFELISKEKERILKEIENFDIETNKFHSELTKIYGEGQINVKNGEFTKNN